MSVIKLRSVSPAAVLRPIPTLLILNLRKKESTELLEIMPTKLLESICHIINEKKILNGIA